MFGLDPPRPAPRAPRPAPRSSDLLRRANRDPAPRNARSSRSWVAYSGRQACSTPAGPISR